MDLSSSTSSLLACLREYQISGSKIGEEKVIGRSKF